MTYQEFPEWDAGRIDYSGTYPRLEGSLRNDSARMLRAYRALAGITMADAIGRAFSNAILGGRIVSEIPPALMDEM
jgi:hypothetical protein